MSSNLVTPSTEIQPFKISGLSVWYQRDGAGSQVVRDVSFSLHRGQITGLVGESGCGKSTLGLAAMGFPVPGMRVEGSVYLDGEDILQVSRSERSALWGKRLSFVPQSLAGSLNPVVSVGRQLLDPAMRHLGISRRDAMHRVQDLLDLVQVPSSREALRRKPSGFSGGQRQRLALAAAFVCQPDVIILDEPTTGLDVTTQVDVSKLIRQMIEATGATGLYISHDIGLLTAMASEIVVMYAGEVVEHGQIAHVVQQPRHPYTRALLTSVPSVDDHSAPKGLPGSPPTQVVESSCGFANRCPSVIDECRKSSVPLVETSDREVRCLRAIDLAPYRRKSLQGEASVESAVDERSEDILLAASGLERSYPGAGGAQKVLDKVSFDVAAGEVVALVGESGSGKSTLLRMLVGLDADGSGAITLKGHKLARRASSRTTAERAAVQLIPQDSDSSLNPRQTVEEAVLRPLELFRPELSTEAARAAAVRDLFSSVGLDPRLVRRYPHELSGGQRQRVSIARALAAKPQVLVCDEITSALDVSVQAMIIELLLSIVMEEHMSAVFVTHNLALLPPLADRVLVLDKGVLVEQGGTTGVFAAPQAEYTRKLLASASTLDIDARSAAVG